MEAQKQSELGADGGTKAERAWSRLTTWLRGGGRDHPSGCMPPMEPGESHQNTDSRGHHERHGGGQLEKAREADDALGNLDGIVFTDVSVVDGTRAGGAGVVVRTGDETIRHWSVPVGARYSSYAAELKAMLEAATWLKHTRDWRRAAIVTDSKSLVDALGGETSHRRLETLRRELKDAEVGGESSLCSGSHRIAALRAMSWQTRGRRRVPPSSKRRCHWTRVRGGRSSGRRWGEDIRRGPAT